MMLIRSLAFNAFSLLTMIFFALFGLLTAPLPFHFRYRFFSQWARINLWWLRVTCGIRYEVQGAENIPEGGGILLCKHQSTWETLALQQIFPPQVWVLKKQLLFLPFFGWGLALLEPIAINRSSRKKAMTQIIEQGRQRLADGRWVVIFPEGTRIPAGTRGHYKLGGARLAEATQAPTLAMVHNAGEHWPKRKLLKRPGVIHVRISAPIATAGRSVNEINQAVETWIEDQMLEICSPENRARLAQQRP